MVNISPGVIAKFSVYDIMLKESSAAVVPGWKSKVMDHEKTVVYYESLCGNEKGQPGPAGDYFRF